MDKLFIVIPAYNEEETIETVVRQWYPVVEERGGESRLVVIDDGSKDKTYSILQRLAESMPQLTAVTKSNEGHGATVLYGYQYSLNSGADFVFQTDSDGQTLPEEFDQFWDKRYEHDMIIGWRNKRQDGFSRIVVTRTLRLVIRICFGVRVKDANTPYRLMNAETLKQYIELIPDKFNLSNVLLTVLYEKKGRSVLYIPITFKPRQGGVNSINLKKIFKIGKQAVKDFSQINKSLN